MHQRSLKSASFLTLCMLLWWKKCWACSFRGAFQQNYNVYVGRSTRTVTSRNDGYRISALPKTPGWVSFGALSPTTNRGGVVNVCLSMMVAALLLCICDCFVSMLPNTHPRLYRQRCLCWPKKRIAPKKEKKWVRAAVWTATSLFLCATILPGFDPVGLGCVHSLFRIPLPLPSPSIVSR